MNAMQARVVVEMKLLPYSQGLVHFHPILHPLTDTVNVVVVAHRVLRRCRTLLDVSPLAYPSSVFGHDGEVVVCPTIVVLS